MAARYEDADGPPHRDPRVSTPDNVTAPRLGLRVTRVFVPFAIGYFLSYLYRTINAVLGPVLMDDLMLKPSAIGFLTGTYFLAFALSQIPLGLAIDRFGPRRTEGSLMVVGAVGAVIFAISETIIGLSIGRGLIGLGVSGCLVCAFKAFAIWFPKERLPLVNGCILGVGGLGAIVASSPFQRLLVDVGWPTLFGWLAAATFISAVLILTAVPEKSVEDTPTTLRAQFSGLLGILKSPAFWLITPLITTAQAAWFSHQALWLGPWLGDVAKLSPAAAADSLLMGALGMVAGFVGFGVLAERLGHKGVSTSTVAASGTALFVVVQILLTFPIGVTPWLLCFGFGFFGGAISLFYADLTQQFPLSVTGRVTTTAALLAFFGGFVLNVVTGLVLDRWPGLPGYQIAFGGAVILQILAFAWFVFHVLRRRRP